MCHAEGEAPGGAVDLKEALSSVFVPTCAWKWREMEERHNGGGGGE